MNKLNMMLIICGIFSLTFTSGGFSLTLPLTIDSWSSYRSQSLGAGGRIVSLSDGLRNYADAYRNGSIMVSNQSFDVRGATIHYKWMANGGGTYSWGNIGVYFDEHPLAYLEYIGHSTDFTTHHSWGRSTRINDNTWYYTTINIDMDQTFRADTYTGNYGYLGGTFFNNKTAHIADDYWIGFENAQIGALTGDNYSPNAWIQLAEVDLQLTTKPVPEPATTMLMGIGVAGLGLLGYSRKRVVKKRSNSSHLC